MSRRAALTTAALTPLALAGCDIDPPRRPDEPGSAPDPSEDALLVETVVSATDRTAAVVTAAGDAFPALAATLAPLAAAHQVHRGRLAEAAGEAASQEPPEVAVPPRRRAALAAVRRAERELERELVRGVDASASGDLARMLASMAASVAQHVAALDEAVVA